MKERMKKVGIKAKVITLEQLKKRYYTHAMQRELADKYDLFLMEGGYLYLRRSYFDAEVMSGKCIIPINVKEDKLKFEFDRIMQGTAVMMGISHGEITAAIGSLSMSEKELTENVIACTEKMVEVLPSGLENLASVDLTMKVKIKYIKVPLFTGFDY
ncbi:hypothetical protein EIN_267980 [Entamoeba invadens IP1]|uniref:Uncharacterized protein n=1 Tax=Entamoeba invadens IP1 TaxID=370355 RepID=A0A0A1UBL0_ENTIV|nr:hypothetical protein EIN_267980 [Entamoeba invadens IP1]ELP91062.1 hypothetical protein EIN_267980 [Entamoeba invadens IP1]|eukprot:XP_004257833.1 hypothetical protein EIN_267980 [Entamoeba invadens IP1]